MSTTIDRQAPLQKKRAVPVPTGNRLPPFQTSRAWSCRLAACVDDRRVGAAPEAVFLLRRQGHRWKALEHQVYTTVLTALVVGMLGRQQLQLQIGIVRTPSVHAPDLDLIALSVEFVVEAATPNTSTVVGVQAVRRKVERDRWIRIIGKAPYRRLDDAPRSY